MLERLISLTIDPKLTEAEDTWLPEADQFVRCGLAGIAFFTDEGAIRRQDDEA